MPRGPSYSRPASGNISPYTFVTLQTDGTVQTTGTNGDALGIAGPSPHRAPLQGWDDGFVATGVTDPAVPIYGPGDDEALLQLGGTVAAGALIKSTSTGTGVATSSTGDRARARAKIGGISGDVIPVWPVIIDTGSATI